MVAGARVGLAGARERGRRVGERERSVGEREMRRRVGVARKEGCLAFAVFSWSRVWALHSEAQ